MHEPTVHRVRAHGIDIHCVERGKGEPLVLLHGFTGAGDDWTHVYDLEELAQSYRVIIPDLRGHGRTTNPEGTFTIAQCARDVAALLDELAIERTRAVGMSLGGNVLLHLATQAPERIDAMVLVSAAMYFPAEARAIMRTMTEESRSPDDWALMRARHMHGDDQIRALWAYARGFADSHDDMAFTPPKLATIRARVLVVHGDRDPLYPVDMAVAMFRAIPEAALWVVPHGGHGPIFAPDERAAFVRTSLAFLAASVVSPSFAFEFARP